MRILLDMDEVICRWVDRIIQYYNEDHGTSYTRKDVSNWNVATNLGPGSEDAIRSYMRYIELYRDLEPVEGALPGMRRLLDDGHDVVIVTAVPKCAGISYHGKLEWLRRNTPFFPLKNLIACSRKDLVMGDVLFDDGLHNIGPFAASRRHAVIMDCPWNVDVTKVRDELGKDWSYVARVSHWNQFLSFIDLLVERKSEEWQEGARRSPRS